jgi:elongation factor P
MLDFTDIKAGKIITYNGSPCVITKCDFLRMQMRKPVKKCTMRNLVTGAMLDYSFKSGEALEEADIKRDKATFTYINGDMMSFMTSDTYETVEISVDMLEGKTGYLREGLEVVIINFNDQPISVELPIKVTLTVTYTTDVVKGSTVGDVNKDATMETGAVLKVPSFVKIGDRAIFNTEEDEYCGREN